MNTYSTDELLGVVRSLLAPQTFLTRTFFGTEIVSTSKTVHIDVIKGKRRLAPFVHPRSQGRIFENEKYATNSITPAYIKMKSPYDPEDAIEFRTPGESLTGSLTPQEREQAWVAKTLMEHMDAKDRRLEWMAAQILQGGTVTITGEGFDDVSVDFGRDSDLNLALAGPNRWGEAGVSPLENLRDWSLDCQEKSGAYPSQIVMDPLAWTQFNADEEVQRLLDTRRGSEAMLEGAPAGRAEPQRQGTLGPWTFWTYQDWYEDPSTGASTQLLTDYSVIGASPAMEGKQHFGAIRDSKAGYMALPFFPKMWEEQDPSAVILMSQSAPILAPWRPDASFGGTVR